MGFFKVFGRVMQGKPAFDEEDGITQIHSSGSSSPHLGEDSEEEHDGIIKNNPSTFPIVRIERFKTYHNGHEVEVGCDIKNEWHHQIIVQSVQAYGKKQPLGVWLQPEQSRQIILYKGPAFEQQPNGEILLDYKTEHEGDYFEAVHDTHFLHNSEQQYEVSDIRMRMPIRDIYG